VNKTKSGKRIQYRKLPEPVIDGFSPGPGLRKKLGKRIQER